MSRSKSARALKWMLAPVLALAVVTPAAHAQGERSPFASQLESRYVDPDRVYSTDVRWWLGSASHTDETLLEEIQALYDGGFRGVELCMQADNVAPNELYAYGSEMWAHKWNLMMNKLLDLGMSVYLTSGTNWATSNVPGLDPSSQEAMQNLTLGTATVNAGSNLTALPAPAANARRAGAKFVTAYAYKVTAGNTVDPNSRIDLSPTQGADVWSQNLSWTAPGDGTYRVFAMWTQGTFQSSSPAAQTSYATNYFDERGVAALKRYWEEHYLKDPALAAKIKQGDVQLFMDSLEINTGGGFTWWAEDMAQEFKARKGYDITPYLFLIAGVAASVENPYHSVGTTGTYRLNGDEQRRQKIVNDYQDVLTQLYMERMLTPLKTWLNSVGIETRAQISYGKPLEISEPAMAVDYPEAENLNQYNQADIFRLWTGGAKLENKVLSSETGAEIAAFNSTPQMKLRDAYNQFAVGFQRQIWHVWAADYGYGNFAWPGYSPRGANLTQFHFLGKRNPGSADYDEFNAHLGRVQQLMQTGKSRTDVGFVHQNWTQGMQFLAKIGNDNTSMQWQYAHQGVYYRSTELQDNGYTYDYFSPKFLFDDDVRFDESTKTIEKAGYKAVVLYQSWLDLDGAKRIRDWAGKGLKVVILGDAAKRTPHNDGKDAELASVISELKALPTVRTATVADSPADYFGPEAGGYDDNVLEKLQELGVRPTVGYPRANHQLLTQTRQDERGNEYVYVYNYCPNDYHHNSHKADVRGEDHGTNIKTDIEKDGLFVPYFIDAWSGKVTEIADYRWENGRTIVPIDLDYNNVALLAFEKVDRAKLHVVSTNGASARAIPGGVAVRATHTGTVATELSNGVKFQQAVTVPAPSDITGWDLTVQSQRPNPIAGDLVRTETIDGLTTVNRKTSTVKTPIKVKLDTLTTWDKIPAVGKGVSGTGHYEARFTWDARTATGAYLDFGDRLEESMEVWINGRKVGGQVSTNPTKVRRDVAPFSGQPLYSGGVSWTKPVVDVSPYLVDGENTIVIDYSSALANVQLDRGIITEQSPLVSAYRSVTFWGNNQVYLASGPKQAKLVPFVDVHYVPQDGTVGGTVPATLSLTLGTPPSFGAFTPGIDKEYTADTTANVISTAGEAALTVSDPGHLTNGAFRLAEPLRVQLSKASWTAPVSNDTVDVAFKQLIKRTDPLRTGSYSRTVTFTLSTTTP